MISIRWMAAAIVMLGLAGTAMSQPSPQGATPSGVDQSNQGSLGTDNTNSTNSGPSNMGNPNPGTTNPSTAPGSSVDTGATTTKKCHWWSMSKECRQQRQYENTGSSNTGTSDNTGAR